MLQDDGQPYPWYRHIWNAMRGDHAPLTSGSIRKALFYLAVPMILELLIEGCFGVVDMLCLSRVSQDAVTTVGITENVLFIIYSISIGLGMGTTALVARRIGEGDEESACIAAWQGILLALMVSVGISCVGVIYSEEILGLFTKEASVIEVGAPYTRIILGTNAVILLLFVLNSIFRGTGEAHYAMYALVVSSILNIVLDIVLIFGLGPFPELGVPGAAIATSIGRGVGVLLQLVILFRGLSVIKFRRYYLRWRKKVQMSLIQISSGGILQFAIESFSWIVLTYLIVQYGSETRTGYFISFRVIVFVILPAIGLANAGATLMGQNLGADQVQRASKSVWMALRYNLWYLIFVSLVSILWAPRIIEFFMSDPEVIRQGAVALRIISLGNVFFGCAVVLGHAFNGAGDTWTPTRWNFVVFWAVQIPLAYVLSRQWGVVGVYWAIAISSLLITIVLWVLFRQGKWANVKV